MRDLRHHTERGPTLFPEMDEADREPLAAKAAKSAATLEFTRPQSIAILDTAFGGSDWLPALEKAAPSARRGTFLRLYHQFLLSCGATHVLEIPTLNEDGVHVYSLLHATRNAKGYAAMKGAVTTALRQSPLPRQVTERMIGGLAVDLEPIVQLIHSRFAGKEVRWAENPEDKKEGYLKQFALENTPMFPFQAQELQQRLVPFRLPGRSVRFAFPGTTGSARAD